MTASAAESPARAPERAALAHAVELLMVGGATVVLFPLAWLLRRAVGLGDAELTVGFLSFYGAYVINDPHFAVTYLLFYRDFRGRCTSPTLTVAQRIRYVLAGLVVPLALVAWGAAAIALHAEEKLGWMAKRLPSAGCSSAAFLATSTGFAVPHLATAPPTRSATRLFSPHST